MQLLRGDYHDFQHSPCAITIGNYDGVHLGHQQLISVLKETANELQLPSMVMTFEPQPREFFDPDNPVPRLTRFREKWNEFERLGIDAVCCLRFNKKLAALSPEDFVREVLVKRLQVKAVIVGDDFRFGAKRAGDFAMLEQFGEQYGFRVQRVDKYIVDGERVSSTRVRNSLEQGDLATVKKLLGRSYTLCGKVSHGDKRGHDLGFPTANLHLHRRSVPILGVYAVLVHGIEEKPLPASAYIGTRPVFDGDRVILEVFILDFNRMIYGCNIEVEFLNKIRDDQHFPDWEALVVQVEKDIDATRAFFR